MDTRVFSQSFHSFEWMDTRRRVEFNQSSMDSQASEATRKLPCWMFQTISQAKSYRLVEFAVFARFGHAHFGQAHLLRLINIVEDFCFISNKGAEPSMRILCLHLTNPMALAVYLFLFTFSLLCSSISSCFEVQKCGEFELGYPFGLKSRGCGDPDFQLQCDDQSSNPLINIGGDEYRILNASSFANSYINNNMNMRIVKSDLLRGLLDGKCNLSANYSQFWSPFSHFHIASTYTNLTIWGGCDKSLEEFSQFMLCGKDWYYDTSKPEEGTHFCKTHLQIPIPMNSLNFNMNQNFPWQQGFEVTWDVDPSRFQSCQVCCNSHGICGYNISERPSSMFLCYCPDGSTNPEKCPDNGRFPDKCLDKLCNPAGTEDTGRGRDQNISAIAIGCFVVGVVATAIGLAVAVFLMYDACKIRNPPPPPQRLPGNGNEVVDPPHFSYKSESSLFTSTERSSSIEMGV